MNRKIFLTSESNKILSCLQFLMLITLGPFIVNYDFNSVLVFNILIFLMYKKITSFFYTMNKKLYIEWIRYKQKKTQNDINFIFMRWFKFGLSLFYSTYFCLNIYSIDMRNVHIFTIYCIILSILLTIPIFMYIFIFLIDE
jgi:hypothetical protein